MSFLDEQNEYTRGYDDGRHEANLEEGRWRNSVDGMQTLRYEKAIAKWQRVVLRCVRRFVRTGKDAALRAAQIKLESWQVKYRSYGARQIARWEEQKQQRERTKFCRVRYRDGSIFCPRNYRHFYPNKAA